MEKLDLYKRTELVNENPGANIMSMTYRLQFLAMGFEPTLTRATLDFRSESEVYQNPHTLRIILDSFGKNLNPNYRNER